MTYRFVDSAKTHNGTLSGKNMRGRYVYEIILDFIVYLDTKLLKI